MRAFADALDSVPMALAGNSGLGPIETLASIKSRQVKEKNSRLGVDCMQTGSNGMQLASFFSLSDVLTFYRYAAKFCHRSIDWKATTAITCDSIMPHGSQNQ